MSIQAIAWALDQRISDAAAKLVLIALANAFNQQRGRCFPTIRQIMQEASVSERTAQRKIRALAEMGLIKIVEARAESGRQMANEYLLNTSGEGVNLTGGGCHDDGGEGVTRDGGEGVRCDTPYKEPEETPEENTLGASAPKEPAPPDHFEEFWSAYPKREGPNPKKPAREKFKALVGKGRDPSDIISAAWHLSKQHPTPTRFCPQAVTWLGQERFNDDDGRAPAPLPASEGRWRQRLDMARQNRAWFPDDWGPAPGREGCLVPSDLLASGDGQGWTMKKAMAAA